MDQNQIALPGIEHLPMDDGLVADAADMSVLEESIQMMRTRQRLSAEPSHIFFLKTSIFHLDWLLHVAQIQVRSLTKCSVNVRDVSLHRGQAICIEHDVVKQKVLKFQRSSATSKN